LLPNEFLSIKPGQLQMRFAWCPVAGDPTTDQAPSQETISGQLAGPFATRAAAEAAQAAYAYEGREVPLGGPRPPLQPVAGTMAPFSTDTWASDEHESTLALPKTPGFYIFVLTTVTVAPAGSSGPVGSMGGPTGIVQVVD
jgi:hypothetical protein